MTKVIKLYDSLADILSKGQDWFLLVIRLYWGWQFFQTGKGKLGNIAQVTEFFQSLNIPQPALNAYLAGITECLGGLFLLLGLGVRLVNIPLIFTMVVAYLTAHRDSLQTLFSNPDGFFQQDPFLFLFTAVIVLLFGPGKFSLEQVMRRYIGGECCRHDAEI